jgi:uncharacterized protein
MKKPGSFGGADMARPKDLFCTVPCQCITIMHAVVHEFMKTRRSANISLEDITETLRRHKSRLHKEHRINEIGVFGSFVRGEQKEKSDIDVLVEFEEVPGLIEFIQIEDGLCRLLKKKVDLVRKGAIRPEIKDHILSEVVYL